MGILLREYVGAKIVYDVKENDSNLLLKDNNAMNIVDDESIMVDAEAMHEIITRNFTLYTKECMTKSISK